MKTAYITEVCAYEMSVPDNFTEAQTEEAFCKLDSEQRDKQFGECIDRTVWFEK